MLTSFPIGIYSRPELVFLSSMHSALLWSNSVIIWAHAFPRWPFLFIKLNLKQSYLRLLARYRMPAGSPILCVHIQQRCTSAVAIFHHPSLWGGGFFGEWCQLLTGWAATPLSFNDEVNIKLIQPSLKRMVGCQIDAGVRAALRL